MSLYLKQLQLGAMQNFVYLIGDPDTHEAAVVDPAWNGPAILDEVRKDGYRLTHVILTHGHYDHINAVEEIVDKTDATVCGHKSELEEFIAEGHGGLVIPRSSLKKTVSGDSVTVGKMAIRLIHTPGHTPGSQCLLIEGRGEDALVVTGDTLFIGTIGRCDLPFASPHDLFHSLVKLKQLKDETVIYPGHDYGASPTNTMKKEKRTNPFLLVNSMEEFLQMVRH